MDMKTIRLRNWSDNDPEESIIIISLVYLFVLIMAFFSWKAVAILAILSLPTVIEIKDSI